MKPAVASSILLLVLLLVQPLAAFVVLPRPTQIRPSGRGLGPAAAAAAHEQHQQQPEEPSSNAVGRRSAHIASSREEYLLRQVGAALVGSVSAMGMWGGSSGRAVAGASVGGGGVGMGVSSLLVAAVKASSLAEAQAAARNVKVCLRGVQDMQKAANEGDWTTVRLFVRFC